MIEQHRRKLEMNGIEIFEELKKMDNVEISQIGFVKLNSPFDVDNMITCIADEIYLKNKENDKLERYLNKIDSDCTIDFKKIIDNAYNKMNQDIIEALKIEFENKLYEAVKEYFVNVLKEKGIEI